MNFLFIQLFHAKNLPNRLINTHHNTFCRIDYGNHIKNTKLIKNKENPEWVDEFHIFKCDENIKSISLKFFDVIENNTKLLHELQLNINYNSNIYKIDENDIVLIIGKTILIDNQFYEYLKKIL